MCGVISFRRLVLDEDALPLGDLHLYRFTCVLLGEMEGEPARITTRIVAGRTWIFLVESGGFSLIRIGDLYAFLRSVFDGVLCIFFLNGEGGEGGETVPHFFPGFLI